MVCLGIGLVLSVVNGMCNRKISLDVAHLRRDNVNMFANPFEVSDSEAS